jgi:uncharacterized protein YcfJ
LLYLSLRQRPALAQYDGCYLLLREHAMKLPIFALIAAGAGCLAHAQEIGRVISSAPVIQQVAVPQQYCSHESFVVQGANRGGGAVIGAIAGGAIGNAAGHGGGRVASTALGIISGAIIGDRLEGKGADQVQQVRHCTTQTNYENRVIHYDVVYEYGGRSYAVQMPHDPGPTVRLQVTPIGATLPAPVAVTPPPVFHGNTVITQTQTYAEPMPYYIQAPSQVFIALPAVRQYTIYPRHGHGPRGQGYGYGGYPRQLEPRWR